MKQTDPVSGFTCFRLQSETMEVRVAPEAGSNLFSIRHAGRELLKQPESLAQLPGFLFGVPVLYPTPGRVAGGRIRLNGSSISLPEDSELGCIHGFVHSAPWNVVDVSSSEITTEIVIDPDSPLFGYLPICHTLQLRIQLANDAIRWEYCLQNQDQQFSLPFGFGLHPWLLRDQGRILAHVFAKRKLELADGMPTGRLLTSSPLRDGKCDLTDVSLDDVFWLDSFEPAIRLEWGDNGKIVEFSSSPDFQFAVLYVPPHEPWICPENWTCSPNAHNTYESEHSELSGLLSVPPGGSKSGWVTMTVK